MKQDVYRKATINIRQQFEANKDISDPEKLELTIKKAQDKIAEWRHPDPYTPPCRPGGTKYQRNIPVARGPIVPGDW
ncbi:CIB22 NADH dehydrogenase [ubiquinone] 1 beta subcomplex subunit 9 [Candida maltosa Xu316]